MTVDAAAPSLPPRLEQLLGQLADRALSGRLKRVYLAAAHAIDRLGDLDLLKYETASLEGSPDLSLWEEMAPVIRDTVMDVNALLTVIREHFPVNTPGGLAETLSRAIEEAGPLPPGSRELRRVQEAEAAMHSGSTQLAQEITHLGERMRSPQVVSDRWNLLADIQTFRARFRDLMADLVFASASAFAELNRKDVVPGYEQEVKLAVVVRATVADLTRVMKNRVDKIREAEAEDIQWHAQQFEKELDVFGKTQAYRALRAQDKRQVIEFRHELGKMAVRPNLPKRELEEIGEPFFQFISSLSRVNNRDLLVNHDREVWAACGVRLEQAQNMVDADPAGAGRLLNECAVLANQLYGREAGLDVFLRKSKKTPLSSLPLESLKPELDKFRELLASLPLV